MRMRHAQRRRWILPILLWTVVILGGAFSGLFAWGNQPAPESAPTWRVKLQHVSGVGAPWLAVVLAVTAVLGKSLRPRRHWKAVHDLLTSFRGTLFAKEAKNLAPEHEHRITLFKHVRWRWSFCRWPWSGWLIPIERSGASTQSSSSAFRAPDDPTKATGIAGLCFYLENILPKEDLPDVAGDDTTEEALQAYAETTGCTVDYVRRRRPWARSYMGFRVVVKGRAWGVVVVDSASVKPKKGYKDKQLYGLLEQTLGIVLE